MAQNILFIMCDQLRADYLGCNGHPSISTPNIDALANRGVNFTQAYCQAPVCGPSRMSFYTGRYLFSHGSTYNNVPLPVGERTLGDYLRPHGLRVGLTGKTHFAPDHEGMSRLGIDPQSEPGMLVSQCGFEPWERDDGVHPDQSVDPDMAYNQYLRNQGYAGENPWHSVANSAEGPNGEILSGWQMRNARLPARVSREHSETAYMTNRAMHWIDQLGDQPWCLHLSYIKPHWPYIVPAPYHSLYAPEQILTANRQQHEKEDPHPVVAAFMKHEESINFSRDEVRETVIPAYMGLITEIDDHLGRLMDFLEKRELLEKTMIVFTSDHGDYLGDHWLGEKELFHEETVKIPMILVDPSAKADSTRGTCDSRFVESIDLIPTFLDVLGGDIPAHRLEGNSLLGLLRNSLNPEWRDTVYSEADYAWRKARLELGLAPDECRAFMVRTERWKYIQYQKFPPQLFDLQSDPKELKDLGSDPTKKPIRDDMETRLNEWIRKRRLRSTISHETIDARTGTAKDRGYMFGVW
ncbi:MAG: sulfatase-like hydrolase/transferase [SAR324 cluster bacterium]|jgi:arylsulfatase A-like enzyme|nr:sulfatase-like hydrolase/transferase [SAR324 cluster bacterium]|tara:strand:+ start:2032 stop:3600 length:1569 start_codon:yes stop_codon:yes gene_type:complete